MGRWVQNPERKKTAWMRFPKPSAREAGKPPSLAMTRSIGSELVVASDSVVIPGFCGMAS